MTFPVPTIMENTRINVNVNDDPNDSSDKRIAFTLERYNQHRQYESDQYRNQQFQQQYQQQQQGYHQQPTRSPLREISESNNASFITKPAEITRVAVKRFLLVTSSMLVK